MTLDDLEKLTPQESGETEEVLHALRVLARRLPGYSPITIGHADNSYAVRSIRYWMHRMDCRECDHGPACDLQ